MGPNTHENQLHFDIIIVGTGFGGLYALHKFRDHLKLRARVFEKECGVGNPHPHPQAIYSHNLWTILQWQQQD
ncbi:unnamed protein product [Adineta ricciae]|uniref:FAD/NAD(P)-binding domain-containing protein n=1 Tax=Adineta ricciae TaxID=249248 RepID=A0A815AFA2_ADIRI|nr:unnamed protein product [Adineta ricciae]CAF1300579.1 unnamed protein product [Adineta ricciae]